MNPRQLRPVPTPLCPEWEPATLTLAQASRAVRRLRSIQQHQPVSLGWMRAMARVMRLERLARAHQYLKAIDARGARS